MAFTNKFYDNNNVNKYLDDNYNSLNYIINTPGNGVRPHFIKDPQLRLQKFGGNISDNITDINSSLIGLNKVLSKNIHQPNDGRSGNSSLINPSYKKIFYPSYNEAIIDESRSTMPAWQIRDIENNHWMDYLYNNPQENTEIKFSNNINSRILEKDNYTKKF